MRRKAIAVTLLALATLALAGCGKPPGVDGQLVNGWPAMPEPKIPVPPSPACYSLDVDDPSAVSKWPAPVDCTSSHTIETIFVGQFTGADADRTSPPSHGGPQQRAAYQQCASASKTFLGGDWRTGRLELFLVLPSAMHWDAGARHYRCDLVQYASLDKLIIKPRTGSLKGALTSDSALRLGCVVVDKTGDKIDSVPPAGCAGRHNGEFAGVFDNPDGPFPSSQDARSKADLAGCRAVAARFAGIPNDKNFQYRTGLVASPFPKSAWELGNRGVRCYLWNSSRSFTGSLKGAGPKRLPVG